MRGRGDVQKSTEPEVNLSKGRKTGKIILGGRVSENAYQEALRFRPADFPSLTPCSPLDLALTQGLG